MLLPLQRLIREVARWAHSEGFEVTGPPRVAGAGRLIDGIQESLPTLSLAQPFDEASVFCPEFATLHLIYYQ